LPDAVLTRYSECAREACKANSSVEKRKRLGTSVARHGSLHGLTRKFAAARFGGIATTLT